jgi:hypothetical protein
LASSGGGGVLLLPLRRTLHRLLAEAAVDHEEINMTLPGRKLSVKLRRNESKDEQVGAVEYTGYDACWPSGCRIRGLGFDRFCKIGVRYLLGRDKPAVADLDLYFVPLEERGSLLPRVPGCRLRVLYLQRGGDEFKLFLSDETPTDIAFGLRRDEASVLEWIGARGIADGGRQWFALYAVRNGHSELFTVSPRAARRARLAGRQPALAYGRAPLVGETADGRFLTP